MIFNITFSVSEITDLNIRVLNVLGIPIYSEIKEKFIGEYIKQINLEGYSKGTYFLEIAVDSKFVNRKIIFY